jgi:hypothetical protein
MSRGYSGLDSCRVPQSFCVSLVCKGWGFRFNSITTQTGAIRHERQTVTSIFLDRFLIIRYTVFSQYCASLPARLFHFRLNLGATDVLSSPTGPQVLVSFHSPISSPANTFPPAISGPPSAASCPPSSAATLSAAPPATLAYLSQTLVQTIHLAEDEHVMVNQESRLGSLSWEPAVSGDEGSLFSWLL